MKDVAFRELLASVREVGEIRRGSRRAFRTTTFRPTDVQTVRATLGASQAEFALMLRPEQGPVIPGAGGLRKVRWTAAGAGKRGGLRVIYYFAPGVRTFYMVYAYAKSEQEDLTPAQTQQLGRLVQEEFK